MQSRKQLENTINLTQNLKNLAQAYEQISVNKMQRARGKVFAARDYINEISEIFKNVRTSYKAEIDQLSLLKKGKNGEVTYSTLNKNGKSIAVLVSTNGKLYGDIGRKVFKFFMNGLSNDRDSDIFIIGKVGKEMYEDSFVKKEYKYVDLPDESNAKEAISEILRVLGQYQHVTVYYGQFINFLNQNPTESDVTGNQKVDPKLPVVAKKKFFFEPSLKEILSIFENQIFATLFRQTLSESELSNVGARIRQMESALQNIGAIEGKLRKERKVHLKREESRKQLQRLTGRLLWR